MRSILLLLVLIFCGCARHYNVTVYTDGNNNKVTFEVQAEVPKTIDTDAGVDIAP